VQQLVRLSSRLRMVCAGTRRRWPFGPARRARVAALQTVRDGLLTTSQLADLLPADGQHIAPAVLLARVDQAALRCTAPAHTSAPATPTPDTPETPQADAAGTGAPHAPGTATPGAPARSRRINGSGSTPTPPGRVAAKPAGATDARSDAEMVAELHRIGGPMSGRKVMRALGVGWPRAKRLVDLAGWSAPRTAQPPPGGHQANGSQPARTETAQSVETTPADHIDSRTTP